MDIVSEVLAMLHVESVRIVAFELTAPWAITIPMQPPLAMLHAVVEGSCWVTQRGLAPLELSAGDCILQLQSAEHTLASKQGLTGLPLSEVFADNGCVLWRPERKHVFNAMRVVHGGTGGPKTVLLGAVCDFVDKRSNPLVESTPQLIHVRSTDEFVHWLRPILSFVKSESSTQQPGYMAVAKQLSTLLFVQALRCHLVSKPSCTSEWLRALSDVRIVRALQMIHRLPDKLWNLKRLAKEAGMSRSAFAARFKELVGKAPIDYLIDWRMQLAAERIGTGTARNLSEVATQVGYGSDRSFARAFKKSIGVTPAEYRKTHSRDN